MKSFGMPKKKRVSSISKRRSTECSWQNSHGRSWQARLQQKAEQPPGYLEIYQHASKDLKQQGGQDWLTLNRFSAISGYFGLLLETSSSVYQPPESPRVVQSPLQTVRPSFSIFSCTRAWPSLLDLLKGPQVHPTFYKYKFKPLACKSSVHPNCSLALVGQ